MDLGAASLEWMVPKISYYKVRFYKRKSNENNDCRMWQFWIDPCR